MPGIYVETTVAAGLDEVWQATQQPDSHVRWDLRFTSIVPTSSDADGRWSFRYSLRLLGIDVHGTGVSVGETSRPDGSRTSALRFDSRHPLSPLRSGSGYWRYVPGATGTRFLTGYDYEPGWGFVGPLIDPWLLRPLTGWLTALSFDTLRIWLEQGVAPERARRRALLDLAARAAAVGVTSTVAARLSGFDRAARREAVGVAAGLTAGALTSVLVARLASSPSVPRARRCRRVPDRRLARAPHTLAELGDPAHGANS